MRQATFHFSHSSCGIKISYFSCSKNGRNIPHIPPFLSLFPLCFAAPRWYASVTPYCQWICITLRELVCARAGGTTIRALQSRSVHYASDSNYRRKRSRNRSVKRHRARVPATGWHRGKGPVLLGQKQTKNNVHT